METIEKTLPENLSVNVIAKWLENDQIKIRVRVTNSLNNVSQIFDYSGGLLAFLPREKTEKEIPDYERRFHTNQIRKVKAREIANFINNRGRMLCDEDERNKGRELALAYLDLDPMGFFNCLISDANCGEMSFSDFCSDLGYNLDSRKDYATWQTCQETAEDIRNLLDSQFEEIRQLVQDY